MYVQVVHFIPPLLLPLLHVCLSSQANEGSDVAPENEKEMDILGRTSSLFAAFEGLFLAGHHSVGGVFVHPRTN